MNGAERVKLNLFQTEFPHILQWLDTSNRYLMVDNILKICPVDIIHYTQKSLKNKHFSKTCRKFTYFWKTLVLQSFFLSKKADSKFESANLCIFFILAILELDQK